MTDRERQTFIVTLTPTPDCTNPIGALKELLRRALRSWGLRASLCAKSTPRKIK